jgi:acetyl esterase
MALDPQVAAMLDAAPAWPGARNIPIDELRAFTRQSSMAAGPLPVPLSVRDAEFTGPASRVPIRIYTPEGEGPFPLVVFFHGGGYVIGDLDTQDMIARGLCYGSGAVTVSVDYRLAPEHRFPAAPDDAFAAVKWVADNAAALGGDAGRLAVAGDSAGANLAAVACLDAREAGGPDISAQILFYGSGNYSPDLPSSREFADGPIITDDDVAFFWQQYLGDRFGKEKSPRAFPYHAEDHSGLPPAFVGTAECDPTRDDAERYGEVLAAKGVQVEVKRYAGMPHGFVSWLGIVPAAQQAIDDGCKFLAARWTAS